MTTANPRAFAVWFKDFGRWSVSSFFTVGWRWPRHVIRPLAAAIQRRFDPVDRAKVTFADLRLVTLHFDGEMESRDVEDKRDFKGKLFYAEPGDVVYSKIDVRNGAIGVVPASLHTVAVSAEYPVYRVLPDVAVAEYVKLVFRTAGFRQQINTMTSGTSGRKRVQPSEVEQIEVPFPALHVQRAIVRRWRDAQDEIDAAKEVLEKTIAALNERIFSLYRAQSTPDVIHSRCFVLHFKDLEQWDTKSTRAAAYRLACPSFRPMREFIEDATESVRPFAEPEKDWPIYGVSKKEGVFFAGMKKGREFNAPCKRIRKDWFVHNPTRSAVGSLGIVPDVPEDAITSPEYQVWRVKETGEERLLPGYVAALVQTPFFIDLVQFYRVGTVKQRMYVQNLRQVRLPCLDESEQRKYAEAREDAVRAIEEAKTHAEHASTEVEEMILR